MKIAELEINIMAVPQGYYLVQGDFQRSQFQSRSSSSI